MPTRTSGFVNTAQGRFFYQEAGRGPAVLLIHGGESHVEWDGIAPALSATHRAIAPDRPGCGQSDAPREGYGRTTQARAIVEFIKALGEERLAVVAHGLGAFLAIELAAAWPYTVARLAMISPVVGALDGATRALSTEEALAERHLYGRAAPGAAAMISSAGTAPDGLLMGAFRCPTLVIKPSLDRAFSRARAERVVQLIPQARLVELADADHLVHIHRPEAVLGPLLAFLAER
jgi:pimeloyl-ACP methyl ester carboxylesterase